MAKIVPTENLRIRQATEKGYIEVPVGGVFDGTYATSLTRRGRVQGGVRFHPQSLHPVRFTDMKEQLMKPINTDGTGCCRCIKAGYYKMGWTNFTREMGGGPRMDL